jgi:ribosomal protein S18 acetylase RimI-like enzyme
MVVEMAHLVETVGVEGIDRVEPLWRSMVEHHRAVIGHAVPVRETDATWPLRRAQYAEWLTGGDAALLLAVPAVGAEPDGYACVRTSVAGPTFDLGERIGELESLAVASHARGAGVGSLLIGAARERMREAGITHWVVSVVDANTGAVRLYEREGFAPFERILIATL